MHGEQSLSGSSVVTQQGTRMGDRAAAAQHGRPLLHLPGSQQQVQQAPAAAAASPSKTDPAGLQRLTAALTAVLSSGMASDFVEGLKPVLHNGKLAISTYIKLAHDPEPVFIGMFASLPAAVTAQKQSAELVGHLPPDVARKLVAQQLAHTDPTAPGLAQRSHGGPDVPPERWQSNTTSESTAVGAGSSSQAAEGEATPKAGKQEQQQQHDSAARKPLVFNSAARRQQQQQQVQQGSGGATEHQQQPQRLQQEDSKAQAQAALQSALAAAAAGGMPGPSPSAIAAAVAAVSPRQPGSALTDDVIRMLLHKGLHALTVAQQQNYTGEQDSNWQRQEQAGGLQQMAQEPEPSLLDIFNTPVSTPGSGTGLAGVLQQMPSPQQQMTQQQRQQALMQQLGPNGGNVDQRAALLNSLSSLQAMREAQHAPGMGAGPSASSVQQRYTNMGMGAPAAAASSPRGVPGSNLPPLLPLQGGGAAAGGGGGGGGGGLPGDLGLALDGALETAMLRGINPWTASSAAMQMSAGMAYSQAPAAYSASFQAGPDQMGFAGYQQQQQQQQGYGGRGMMMGGGQGMGAGYGGTEYGMGGYAGGYGTQQQQQQQQQMAGMGMQGLQYAGVAGYGAADYDHGRAPAAAAAGGHDEGVGDKRKRAIPQTDPRVNCVKSVQYRVSRFPAELHDLCIEHWERARCARVVCNEIQGVMSVQNGRCVVTFNQNDQEVVKGVADYLRYAGEERIKKWRRHVRMVDFPRPGNRSGELMTAEEFLCIVGYQSEQGGGKRARGDYN